MAIQPKNRNKKYGHFKQLDKHHVLIFEILLFARQTMHFALKKAITHQNNAFLCRFHRNFHIKDNCLTCGDIELNNYDQG